MKASLPQRALRLTAAIFAGVLSLLFGLSAQAQIVANGDFESPTIDAGEFFYNPSAVTWSWVFVGQTGVSAADGPWAPGGATTGQMAFLQISEEEPTHFSQSISFSSTGGFVLSYDVATRFEYPGIHFQVTLRHNGNNSLVFTSDDTTVSNQLFGTRTLNFTIASGGNYTLMFEGLADGDFVTDRSAIFDNISITAVPEPATTATLAGLAMLSAAAWRRRNRRGG